MQYIQRRTYHHNLQRGASLVELLTTLGIAGILSAMAVPSLGSLVSQFRERSLLNAFTSSVNRTRSEAIHRNARVVMCKSADGLSCSAVGGWESGWIVFQDSNDNLVLDSQEVLVQVQMFAPGKIRFSGNGPVASSIAFTGLGLPKMSSGEFQAGTLTLCSQSATPVNARKVALSKTGNIRSYQAALEECR